VERVRAEVRALFGTEIGDDEGLLTALTAVSMWNTWDTMRTPMELTTEQARATLQRTITALLVTQ
jgi:TetR/AcrR family transcriptional regulator of autoinduction and epiphytic fitness